MYTTLPILVDDGSTDSSKSDADLAGPAASGHLDLFKRSRFRSKKVIYFGSIFFWSSSKWIFRALLLKLEIMFSGCIYLLKSFRVSNNRNAISN